MEVARVRTPLPLCEATLSRSHGMSDEALGASCLAATLPVTSLPSVSFHDGPAEWWPMFLPWASKRSASGVFKDQANF